MLKHLIKIKNKKGTLFIEQDGPQFAKLSVNQLKNLKAILANLHERCTRQLLEMTDEKKGS